MTTTDKRARQAQGAEALQWRLRAGELPAYTEARERACANPPCEPDTVRCHGCDGSGRLTCQDEDVLRALAFCGLEEARELEPNTGWLKGRTRPSWGVVDLADLPLWLQILEELLAKLPPHRLEMECNRGPAYWSDLGHPDLCVCGGTGKVLHDTPARRWLMVAASLAVARECLAEGQRVGLYPATEGMHVAAALDACEAWLAEPTQERYDAWEATIEPRWADGWGRGDWSPGFVAAADLLTPARVREIAGAEVIRRILRGRVSE